MYALIPPATDMKNESQQPTQEYVSQHTEAYRANLYDHVILARRYKSIMLK